MIAKDSKTPPRFEFYYQVYYEIQNKLYNELIKESEKQINIHISPTVSRRIYNYFIVLSIKLDNIK